MKKEENVAIYFDCIERIEWRMRARAKRSCRKVCWTPKDSSKSSHLRTNKVSSAVMSCINFVKIVLPNAKCIKNYKIYKL